MDRDPSLVETGVLDAAPAFSDPAPYGFAANRLAMSTIATYLHEQGLTGRIVPLEELLPARMLET